MKSTQSPIRWLRLLLLFLIPAALGAGGWFAATRGFPTRGDESAHSDEAKTPPLVTAEVFSPKAGGIDRVCVQPGTVEPFEAADLYAKASGFLVEQNVDIGSRVTVGEVLARISVPEYDKQVQRDAARLKDAEAKVRQMKAHLTAARAEAKAAVAAVTLANVLVRARVAYRQYREKQLERTKELVRQRALESRVVDEQEDFYLSALESENAAKEGVNTAQERSFAAEAKIDQAQADLEETIAGVGVATAELERSQVLLGYTTICSPYTGVVTKRLFHIGDFIKSAEQGGGIPLLTVERTDLMRVVIQVPDLDVPYVSTGDPAVIEIDALPGVVFETRGNDKVEVSRWSNAEDATTRTMRTEVDLKNTDGRLRNGMYGRATLKLQPGAASAVRVPAEVVVGRDASSKGTVRIVRDGRITTIPVKLGTDNGVEVEVVAGLTPADRVVMRTSGPVEDGMAVTAVSVKLTPASH